jgi:hypothetical protein
MPVVYTPHWHTSELNLYIEYDRVRSESDGVNPLGKIATSHHQLPVLAQSAYIQYAVGDIRHR